MAIKGNDKVDVSGSFDIEANIEKAIQAKQEETKVESQLGSGKESGKQEALSKLHMKKSPSLEELEFSAKKDTNRSRSEKKQSPDRLDTDEPLESCTEDQSRQQSESVKRYE